MKKEIGFGIVGCGMISNFHCRAIADVEGATFIGCCSSRESSADRLASEYGGTAFASIEDMLRDPRIDVVNICTPSGAHRDPAVAAARAGKHVMVEKPLEITLEKCDQIIQECRKNGVLLATIFPSRFHQASRAIQQAVEAGKFGRLTLGDAYVKWYRTQQYYDSGNWRGTWALDGGGALMNQAIHSVDLLAWFMGPVETLSAQTATLAHERIEVEDVATVSLRFRSGALGTIVATTAAFPGMLKRIEISGDRGTAILEEEDIKFWSFAEMTPADEAIKESLASKTKTGGGAADPSAIGHAAHAAQIDDFVRAIRTGTAPFVDGAEGRKSVEIILAIYESAKAGMPVRIA